MPVPQWEGNDAASSMRALAGFAHLGSSSDGGGDPGSPHPTALLGAGGC